MMFRALAGDSSRLNVAAFPRYEEGGASSRVRMYQYGDYLGRLGAEVAWLPLFSNSYLSRLYSGKSKSLIEVGGCYLNRVRDLVTARRSDVAWIEKELWPWAPAFLDPGILGSRVPYVVDYDDAVFHNYDEHANSLLRTLMGGKIDAVMRHAHTVVAGNSYIAERACAAGAARVEIVPSVVDARKYVPLNCTAGSLLVIGWIGSPATQYLLEPLISTFSQVLGEQGGCFRTVGARFEKPLFPSHERRMWVEATEAQEIAAFDVGVMPLRDAPFERGKCGYKLIQYMACGLPVVASPVGANRQIVRHGETGFLASTPEEWRKALMTLRSDPMLRRRMGAAGRRVFEREYSLQVTAPRIAEILRRAASGN